MSAIRLCVLMLLLWLLPGCQPRGDDAALMGDAEAAAEVSRLRALVDGAEPVNAEDFECIQALRRRFPQAALVEDTYLGALYKRGDWGSLIAALGDQPAAQLDLKHSKWLALGYFRQGDYPNLVALSEQLEPRFGDDYELLKLHAVGLLNVGRESEAGELLDDHWQTVMARTDVDAMVLRGRAHHRLQQLPKAVSMFELALQHSPGNKVALNALARIYYQQGDSDKAQALSERAAATQAQATARSTQRLQLVNRLAKMQEAWQQEDYAAVLEYAESSLAQVRGDNRRAVLQYIIESNTRLGRPDAAASARAELEKMQQ